MEFIIKEIEYIHIILPNGEIIDIKPPIEPIPNTSEMHRIEGDFNEKKSSFSLENKLDGSSL